MTIYNEQFPIVGIGASAGGLAALEALFSAMPNGTHNAMAFIVVQHLSPDHHSMLSELVGRYTDMHVCEAEDGVRVVPDCVYIIPPNRDMTIIDATLQLQLPNAPRGRRLPIDSFLQSLAQDQHERAVGIILSGTGSDGTLGITAIKKAGGMVIVQAPDSTEYSDMPRSAIATGLVDHVARPQDMPAALIRHAAQVLANTSATQPDSSDGFSSRELKKICAVLHAQVGHDFSQYKRGTLTRRVQRRMAIHQLERPDDYLRYLQTTPLEVEALFRDLLIGVTSFFRDPDAFNNLKTQVLPQLFADKPSSAAFRVWVCGCSTGEEAYSIAILVHEQATLLKQACRAQIFATDIDPQAIERARAGVFPVGIAADVTAERLARYFTLESDGSVYRINKVIRDLLIFSEQDPIKDPPFSRLDLLSCRNLLIYMNADLQRHLIHLFHYALRPGGVLFLGTSETVGEVPTLFTPLHRQYKIYVRQADVVGAARPRFGEFTASLGKGIHQHTVRRRGGDEHAVNLRRLTERALLEHYAQAAVLVDGVGDVLYIHGRTGQFLEPAPGDARMNILAMARDGLRRELTTALHKSVVSEGCVVYPKLQVRTNGDAISAAMTVLPVPANGQPTSDQPPELFLIVLEKLSDAAVEPTDTTIESSAAGQARRIAELEQELRGKDEYLQTTLEEMQTSNEALKSTNEEMQSVNEELQSTNEELETSKEELQSVNEELATINAELQAKVADLAQANNDMNNLLAGTEVGTLFVDHELRISRFTPAATSIINMIQTDIGRPIGHLSANFENYDRLVEDLRQVLDDLKPKEAEVATKDSKWYLMRIHPYRTLESVVEGAVITFVDITRRRIAEAEQRDQRQLLEELVGALGEGITLRDADGSYVLYNQQMEEMTGYAQKEASAPDFLARLYRDLKEHEQANAAMSAAIAGHSVIDQQRSMTCKDGGRIEVLVSTKPMQLLGRTLVLESVRYRTTDSPTIGS